jgi:hypothetical protein
MVFEYIVSLWVFTNRHYPFNSCSFAAALGSAIAGQNLNLPQYSAAHCHRYRRSLGLSCGVILMLVHLVLPQN